MDVQQNLRKQKFLGKTGMIIFITLANMFIPLSTDLYLPALPSLSTYFGVSATITNLTLVSFFFFFAVGTLFWGPMSDKYGRKRILLIGSGLYVASSVVCAISVTIYMMIAARIVQGIGAGAIIAVSTALIKDCFAGGQRTTILALVQSASGLAPMIAPVLGAVLLMVTDWRGSFVALTIAGLLCLLLSFLYQETLVEEERYEGSVWGSLGRLVTVGKNVGFMVPCLIFGLYNLSFMGYIAVSSYIYVDVFGLSEQLYSIFFAANAALSLLGSVAYVRFLTGVNKRKLASACFLIYVASGIFLVLLGGRLPLLFWIGFMPFSVASTISRPFGTNIMLDQQSGDTGSASSLINGIATIFGSIGMLCAALWGDIVFGLGVMICFTGVVSITGWILLMRSGVPCRGVK